MYRCCHRKFLFHSLYLVAVFLLTTIRGMRIRKYAMKTYTLQLIKKIISAFLSPKLFYICHLHPGSIPLSASTLITVGDGGHLILELLTNPSVRWIKKRAGVGDNLLIREKMTSASSISFSLQVLRHPFPLGGNCRKWGVRPSSASPVDLLIEWWSCVWVGGRVSLFWCLMVLKTIRASKHIFFFDQSSICFCIL